MENHYQDKGSELYGVSPGLSRGRGHQSASLYIRLCGGRKGRVLDVGAGVGTYTLPLARSGLDVDYLDHSPAMVRRFEERLRAEPDTVRRRVRVLQGDMRVPVAGRYGTILVPSNVFLMNLTLADQLKALGSFHEALEPDGQLVVESFVPDRQMTEGGLSARSHRVDTLTDDNGRALLCTKTIRADRRRQVFHHYVRHEELRPDGTLGPAELTRVAYRWNAPWALVLLLQLAGFRIAQRLGDFQGTSYRHGTDDYVILVAHPRGPASLAELIEDMQRLEGVD